MNKSKPTHIASGGVLANNGALQTALRIIEVKAALPNKVAYNHPLLFSCYYEQFFLNNIALGLVPHNVYVK